MLVVSGPNMLIICYSYYQIRIYVVIVAATFSGSFHQHQVQLASLIPPDHKVSRVRISNRFHFRVCGNLVTVPDLPFPVRSKFFNYPRNGSPESDFKSIPGNSQKNLPSIS